MSDLAEFKCIKCGYEYTGKPGLTQCVKCFSVYVKWVNYLDLVKRKVING